MTLDEFTRHAGAWGTEIARWPEAARDEAMRIADTPQAQTILSAQRRLDQLLTDATPQAAQARIDRVMHAVVTRLARERPRQGFADLLSRWLVPAAGLACAAGIGALAAVTGPLADSGPEDIRAVLTMIFDSNIFGQGWIVL